MKIKKINSVLFAILLACSSCFAQEESSIWSYVYSSKVNIEEQSNIFSIDLDKLEPNKSKLWANFSPSIVQYVATIALKKKFEDEFFLYLKRLKQDLPQNTGHLLQVTIIVDEFGNNSLPNGFLLPIGAGFDPVDAYSEYLNAEVIQTEIKQPLGFSNTGYFIWLKKVEGEITFSVIPKEARQELIKQSSVMAMKKVEEKRHSFRPFSSTLPNYISRANFWNNQLKEFEQQQNDQNRINQVRALNTRFAALQQEHDKLVQKYDDLKNKLSNNNSFLSTASTLLSIAEFFASNSPNTTPQVQQNFTYDPKIIINQNTIIQKELTIIENTINIKKQDLEKTDGELKKYFPIM